MTDSPETTYPMMTPAAAEAFREYVELGPKRSQVLLAEKLHKQGQYKNVVSALGSISKWSVKYQWPARIASAVTAHVDRMLEEAAELDADTFLETSRKLNTRSKNIQPSESDSIVKIRESVRKPVAKSVASIDVTHSGTIKHAHHDMSTFTDEEIDALAAIAERQKVEAGL